MDREMKDLHEKTVLVTGGTGFVGKALCKKLIHLEARVYVLTRRKSKTRDPDTQGVRYIKSLEDISDHKVDIVINLAGEPVAQRWTKKAKEKIWNSRLDLTSSIISYIEGSPSKPSLLLNASAIGFYGTDAEIEFYENTPHAPGGAFSHSLCNAWEKEASKAELYGVRTVFMRIGAVLEKDGGMLAKLLPAFRLGLGGPIGDGQQWLSWIDREDLIDLILFAIANPSISGAINATAPSPVRNERFASTLASTLRKPAFMRTPKFILRLIFGEMADELMLQGQKVIPRKALESGFIFKYPTLDVSLKHILEKMQ